DGLKTAAAADEIAQKLGKVSGVKSAKVRYVSADATSIDLQAAESALPKIESALGGWHLVVARRSAHMIEARYDESAASRRTVAVARFINKTGNPGLAWLEEMLPDVFETELANSKYLVPTASGHPKLDPDKVHAKGVEADVV